MFQSIFALKILILKGFGDVRAAFGVSMFRIPTARIVLRTALTTQNDCACAFATAACSRDSRNRFNSPTDVC